MVDKGDEQRERLVKALEKSDKNPTFLPHPDSIGVGKFTLHSHHANELLKLLKTIVGNVQQGVTWGEGGADADPRRRMYAFMFGKLQQLLGCGIRLEKEGATNDDEHEGTLRTACMTLLVPNDENRAANNAHHQELATTMLVANKSLQDALVAITNEIHALVPEKYKQCVSMENLIALQPNLHNGASYLPLHLDFPLHDGFGIVIATLGLQGRGTIILADEGDSGVDEERSWSFELDEGQCYILCGHARNKCLHGVLCNQNENRQTLNLRYGLHSKAFAEEEVLQHWPDAE